MAESQQQYRHDSGDILSFQLVRSARKTIGLYVHQDNRVVVRAPNRLSLSHIYDFIRERWQWIQQHQVRLQNIAPEIKIRYQEGAVLLHLGQPLTLHMVSGKRNHVEVIGHTLLVTLKDVDIKEERVESVIVQWQRKQAAGLFQERLQYGHQMMQTLNISLPILKIRRMRSRWGSCSRKSGITLNLELIRMPLALIDYVVIHELCHLIEFNHSAAFYALQSRFMPDWKERKQQLETLSRQYGRF